MKTLLPEQSAACLFHGVCIEARAALATTLAKQNQAQTTVMVTSQLARVRELTAEIETFAGWLLLKQKLEVIVFPEEPSSDMDTNRQADRICERLTTLRALLSAKKKTQLILSTPEAILGNCPDRHAFESRQVELVRGKNYAFKELVETLVRDFDYDAEALCEYPGQVATRGGLIDVYPYDANHPYRLDFFGDTLESIRRFDPTTQRTEDDVRKITLSPAGTVESLRAGEGNFIQYLTNDSIAWILEEPSQLVHDYPLRFSNTKPAGNSIRTFEHLFKARSEQADRRVGICLMDTDSKLFRKAPHVELSTEPVANYRTYPNAVEAGTDRFESEQSARRTFEKTLAEWVKKERYTLHFVAANEGDAQQITQNLTENPATARLKPKRLQGSLSGGFICKGNSTWLPLKQTQTSGGIVLVTADEYFGRQRRKLKHTRERARPVISQVDQLLDFSELTDGDPLVHLQNGVCLFRGLSKIEMHGGFKEMITVEFAERMTLHVPLNESHLLTRYVSLTKARPKLNKIGASAWEKTRREAEIATLDYASELLNLHAKRSHLSGFAFPEDHPWQSTFERAFPFTETPDQLSAIEAAKADMEASQPMDRLICGDVGFGKTEVALRAALKAVLAGKQVALLTPTTVLCQQHFNTFCERMAPYPIIIDSVSRFRSPKQNREILSGLAAGKVDIIVGTHRLLSKDVHFKDLGLLIVDEEQRFGVRQKERVKQMSVHVDVLTLSATPIPRTLYMAMAGARAMSVIETPPADRKPIKTVVKSYSPELVKSAIQAETDRGGQVFYLHNRVATIESVAHRIREMHPKLRIAVGHGQMEKDALETIMTRFVAGEFDVLVCTTIIESGIDIPNCNTLIIEGADRFGLAQLYQIRGRVGRFKRQAYAYLLLHQHARLIDQAQKRLHTLKQHNQIGAGFRIAMRDLELRGAGNLLGAQQSGHIAGVGFELYCQLLKQSVSRLKGEPGADRIRAEVKLDFVATGEGISQQSRTSGSFSFAAIKEAEYKQTANRTIEATLPIDYISEPRLRIDFYRRLALADRQETLQDIAEELADRFGKLPPPAQALIEVSKIRILAEKVGVRRIGNENERLICRLAKPNSKDEFLKSGTRFPRLSATDPFERLLEIQTFLGRVEGKE